jgi:hypothetical protein
MRTRTEIEESAVDDGIFQTSSGNKALLEVLLDIREQITELVNLKKKQLNVTTMDNDVKIIWDNHSDISLPKFGTPSTTVG